MDNTTPLNLTEKREGGREEVGKVECHGFGSVCSLVPKKVIGYELR